ncbi:hypothetical protein LPJ57_003610 [Coemansia sp. RSA 486]|nr:hypothetical protein LPJ57_003610 [Coemansia sp. RSA 486]KAJ2602014.1 hypothetical protein GGF39_000961 [Coemansia sp. RSA 1721]
MPVSSSNSNNADSKHFPLEIRQVPGRGRGFFATRDIPQGQVVLKAAPLTWSMCNDWIKNTCLWCFKFDDRRAHTVKAAGIADAASASSIATASTTSKTKSKNKGRSQPVHFKGVFCSQECKQHAVSAFGGSTGWNCFVSLMDSIERELRATGRNSKPKARPKTEGTASPAATISGDETSDMQCLRKLAGLLCKPKTGLLSESVSAANDSCDCNCTCDCSCDFDPDDVSDDQLASWIDLVWDEVDSGSVFVDFELDDSQIELGRLVATELCIHDTALALTSEQAVDASSAAARLQGDRDVASAELLAPVKTNETDVFRAWLRQEQADLAAEKSSESPPATIAPVRVPLRPRADQIAPSRWGQAFAASAASYALLSRAWKAVDAHLPVLSHKRFRHVYYREKANSFGIWDPPPACAPAAVEDSQLEKECVGFAIYPTAVYFNHSCAPNVDKARVGRAMHFVSNRSVSRGEELLISYGSVSDTVSERRGRLLEHFFFDCICERCIAEASAP